MTIVIGPVTVIKELAVTSDGPSDSNIGGGIDNSDGPSDSNIGGGSDNSDGPSDSS